MRISDYGFLSDCQSAALVNREGTIDWLCFPRFDSPPVFARLLDPGAGHWSLRPRTAFRSTRRYLTDSLVLVTRHEAGGGTVEVREALVFERGSRGHEIGMRVPHTLVRVVEGVEGSVEMETEFSPRYEYGLTIPHMEQTADGVKASAGPTVLELRSGRRLESDRTQAWARFKVKAGETAWFLLQYRRAYETEKQPLTPVAPSDAIEDTAEGWVSWLRLHDHYDGPYAEQVERSAVVLQGLTFQPSGAIAAAATASLPEEMGGDANWDYRYTWLRDASMTLRGRWACTCNEEPLRFFQWMVQLGRRSLLRRLQIMYDVEGRADVSERVLDHLAGFNSSRPVRVGNAAWRQTQLDVSGEVLSAAHLLSEHIGSFSPSTRRLLIELADSAASNWRLPDAGMWESREEPRHNTSSKVMAWVALDSAIKLAGRLDASRKVDEWAAAADDIREAVLRDAWDESAGSFMSVLGEGGGLDASVLLMPLVGFLDMSDPKASATVDAIDRDLCRNDLVRRWPSQRGGFLICSFWLVECLALRGDRRAAEERFERLLALANDLGLLSEMADVETGAMLGNFPQAYSHIGLINAAFTLSGRGLPGTRPIMPAK